MLKHGHILLLMLTAFLASSCVTQQKLAYFRNIDNISADSLNAGYKSYPEPVITAGDNLLITVSALDAEVAAPFNLPAITYTAPGSAQPTNSPALQQSTVDTQGCINFPVVGRLHLAGLDKTEAVRLITDTLRSAINEPVVNLQFLNFSVTVMGEVAHPGPVSTTKEHLTILDALSRAGDLTVYGKRNTVRVVRQNTDGRLVSGTVDINTADVFSSPFYYLRQNDIVYVEPNNVRAVQAQNLSLYLSMITSLASMATVIVSVVNISQNKAASTGGGN